jgi:hypothetical protein
MNSRPRQSPSRDPSRMLTFRVKKPEWRVKLIVACGTEPKWADRLGNSPQERSSLGGGRERKRQDRVGDREHTRGKRQTHEYREREEGGKRTRQHTNKKSNRETEETGESQVGQ